MARILAYTSPGRGHLFPLTAILDELRRRGHHISLRPDRLRAKVREAMTMTAGARRVAEGFAVAGGPTAADAFETRLRIPEVRV
jgi:UDP:flavonoid glycosyltransferase YjiC (YdhE family)